MRLTNPRLASPLNRTDGSQGSGGTRSVWGWQDPERTARRTPRLLIVARHIMPRSYDTANGRIGCGPTIPDLS
ncbi:MAG: hypothetical protein JW801_18470 [Bacteroidales bacterium]|nr:hypothetical protein [Bacteroidales bacterium]